jgi:hypothetical protein
MKFLILLAVVIAGVFSEEFEILEPDEFPIDALLSGNNRIASGVAHKKSENLGYVFLTVQFVQKTQNCGGIIIDKQWIATSGRCVYE